MERKEAADFRSDLRAGIIASLLANIHRDPKKRPEPYSPEDFMPRIKGRSAAKPSARLRPEEMLERIRFINASLGGEDKRGQ